MLDLFLKKHCYIFEQTKSKPQKTNEFKLSSKLKKTSSFNPRINLSE